MTSSFNCWWVRVKNHSIWGGQVAPPAPPRSRCSIFPATGPSTEDKGPQVSTVDWASTQEAKDRPTLDKPYSWVPERNPPDGPGPGPIGPESRLKKPITAAVSWLLAWAFTGDLEFNNGEQMGRPGNAWEPSRSPKLTGPARKLEDTRTKELNFLNSTFTWSDLTRRCHEIWTGYRGNLTTHHGVNALTLS